MILEVAAKRRVAMELREIAAFKEPEAWVTMDQRDIP